MSLNINVNLTAFNKSVKAYERALPKSIKPALEKTGLRIVADVIDLPPKAPVFDGFLTGAFSVTVKGENPIFPNTAPKGGDTGENSKKVLDADMIGPVDTSGMNKYELRIGNSMKYAARLHETNFKPGKWSQRRGGVGYKFLSSKLFNYGVKYRDLLADFIKDELQGRIFR